MAPASVTATSVSCTRGHHHAQRDDRRGGKRQPSAGSAGAGVHDRIAEAARQRVQTELLRRPTGLADGLALKEPAPPRSRGFAPTTWVPRSPPVGED